MKNTLLITLIFTIVNCTNTTQNVTDSDIKHATAFFMDSIISKAVHGDNYIIIPSYSGELSEKDFLNLITDTILTKENIEFMKTQYSILTKRDIKEFFPEKYFSKFNTDEPQIGQISYLMDPPLFTKDKQHFLIYSQTFFWVNDEIKWDDLYFLFGKEKRSWNLEGYIKRIK